LETDYANADALETQQASLLDTDDGSSAQPHQSS